MPPAADRQRLLELHRQLGQALQDDDWNAVARVDQAIREQLQLLASRTNLSAEVLQAKSQLKQLHGKALQACAKECERLRLLLLNHLEYAEGRAAYQQVGLFQGGR